MNAERKPAQEAVFGSSEWAAAFKDAIKQTVSEAVEEHLGAGNPIYFTDDEWEICEMSPDRKVRKLARAEVEQIISQQPMFRMRQNVEMLIRREHWNLPNDLHAGGVT
jgi:hypothetical protein